MAADVFAAELRHLGYEVSELGGERLTFPYEIPVGPRAGEPIELGLTVPGDYNLSCPGGPRVRPRLLPLNTSSSTHPFGGIHAADEYGADWEYWSRPFPGWHTSPRTARAYMAHIAHLFATLE